MKVQEKPSALKREHPAIQNMKFLHLFLFLWVTFALPDPADQIHKINTHPPDPDPNTGLELYALPRPRDNINICFNPSTEPCGFQVAEDHLLSCTSMSSEMETKTIYLLTNNICTYFPKKHFEVI